MKPTLFHPLAGQRRESAGRVPAIHAAVSTDVWRRFRSGRTAVTTNRRRRGGTAAPGRGLAVTAAAATGCAGGDGGTPPRNCAGTGARRARPLAAGKRRRYRLRAGPDVGYRGDGPRARTPGRPATRRPVAAACRSRTGRNSRRPRSRTRPTASCSRRSGRPAAAAAAATIRPRNGDCAGARLWALPSLPQPFAVAGSCTGHVRVCCSRARRSRRPSSSGTPVSGRRGLAAAIPTKTKYQQFEWPTRYGGINKISCPFALARNIVARNDYI